MNVVRIAAVLLLAARSAVAAEPPSIAEPAAIVAGSGALDIALTPGRTVAIRARTETSAGTSLVLSARSTSSVAVSRLLVERPGSVFGPVLLEGGFAELDRGAGGSAASDAWYEAATVTGDGSIVPVSRAGAAHTFVAGAGRPVFATATVASWTAGETATAAVAISLHGTASAPDLADPAVTPEADAADPDAGPARVADSRDPDVALSGAMELVAAASSRVAFAPGFPGVLTSVHALISGESDPTTVPDGWFSGPAPLSGVRHLGLRVTGHASRERIGPDARVEVGAAGFVSLARYAMPGVALRASIRAAPLRALELAGLLQASSPDYRDPNGRRVASPFAWDARATVTLGAVTARATIAARHEPSGATYPRVGLVPGDGPPERSGDVRIGWSGAAGCALRSLDVRGAVSRTPAEDLSWSAGAGSRFVTEAFGGRLEIRPAVSLKKASVRVRLPWVIGIAARPDGSVAVEFAGEASYERVAGEGAAALGCEIRIGIPGD